MRLELRGTGSHKCLCFTASGLVLETIRNLNTCVRLHPSQPMADRFQLPRRTFSTTRPLPANTLKTCWKLWFTWKQALQMGRKSLGFYQ